MTIDPSRVTTRDHAWAVAGPAQWARVRASGYRDLPDQTVQDGAAEEATSWSSFSTLREAEHWARSRTVPALGTAMVLRYGSPTVVTEHARFERGVPDPHFDRAADSTGLRVPEGWRHYLQRPSWLAQGWLASGAFVWLYPPAEATRRTRVWLDARGGSDLAHVLIVGGDGASEHLVVDLREDDSPIYLLPNVCDGWQDRLEQAVDSAAFTAAVEDGYFDFRFEEVE